jgi:hypothetical protein
MPFVAPVSRPSLLSQRPGDKGVPSLAGLAGLIVFSAVVLVATVQWPDPEASGLETLSERPAPTEQWGSEPSRLLQAHQGLTGIGLLHSIPHRD